MVDLLIVKIEDDLLFANLPRGFSSSAILVEQDKKDVLERRIWIGAKSGSDEKI